MIIRNIGELVGIVPAGVARKCGAEMSRTGVLRDAWLRIEDGRIAGFGPMADGPQGPPGPEDIDAQGGLLMPAFCDSHTHVVYAGK